jgi:hypothetical protein
MQALVCRDASAGICRRGIRVSHRRAPGQRNGRMVNKQKVY